MRLISIDSCSGSNRLHVKLIITQFILEHCPPRDASEKMHILTHRALSVGIHRRVYLITSIAGGTPPPHLFVPI